MKVERRSIMTKNQIAYFEASERRRANLAQERLRAAEINESQRHNYATETETRRSNVVSQQLGWSQMFETKRHNTTSENIDKFRAEEQQRHNIVSENQNQYSLGLTKERNDRDFYIASANLAETQRSNKANEALKSQQIGATITAANIAASATRYAADTSASATKYVADTNKETTMLTNATKNNQFTLQLQETIRHNQAAEYNQYLSTSEGAIFNLHKILGAPGLPQMYPRTETIQ